MTYIPYKPSIREKLLAAKAQENQSFLLEPLAVLQQIDAPDLSGPQVGQVAVQLCSIHIVRKCSQLVPVGSCRIPPLAHGIAEVRELGRARGVQGTLRVFMLQAEMCALVLNGCGSWPKEPIYCVC